MNDTKNNWADEVITAGENWIEDAMERFSSMSAEDLDDLRFQVNGSIERLNSALNAINKISDVQKQGAI